MCFSATSSFLMGSAILASGFAALNIIREPRQRAFASIPLIFAMQQFIEGFLWLSLTEMQFAGWKDTMMYIFLFFAQCIWPLWVPFAFFQLEKDAMRRRMLSVILIAGISLSVYLGYCLYHYPVSAGMSAAHIHYSLQFPVQVGRITELVYFIVTIFPAFLSSEKRNLLIGITLFLSFVVSKMFFEENLISVWCFFAALTSTEVYLVLKRAGTSVKNAAVEA